MKKTKRKEVKKKRRVCVFWDMAGRGFTAEELAAIGRATHNRMCHPS
jgi:ribosomal protein L13E